MHPVTTFIADFVGKSQRDRVVEGFKAKWHALVANSLPWDALSKHFTNILTSLGRALLGIETDPVEDVKDGDDDRSSLSAPLEALSRKTREELLGIVSLAQKVGLGGIRVRKIFANVMNSLMTEYVVRAYTGQWESPSTAFENLEQWVNYRFANTAMEVLDCLKDSADGHADSEITSDDSTKLMESLTGRLGSLRISELFDMVVDWNTSQGAIEDLKHYITTPTARSHVSAAFISVLSHRLLQPGASTIEILQIYISIIRALRALDPKGVILDRVARPIRRYLRERDDTVKVIVAGLLADIDPEDEESPHAGATDVLVEVALELNRAIELAAIDEDDGEMDWDDLGWTPDPIDAAPDYKKSKNSDVIGSLLTLFESKETFIKEFQTVMGERLLQRGVEFEKEIRVLELLKLRFGEATLQACEVMLKDALDSRRLDLSIRREQKLDDPSKGITDDDDKDQEAEVPEIHAKILSRLFWPSLRDENFKVPPEILKLQTLYSKGFEDLKQSRKLTWLNALGQVTIELDLEDRVFKDEVLTWQASVIHAFQNAAASSSSPSSSSSSEGVSRTVPSLSAQLEMDPDLVHTACIFWVGKRILEETSPNPPTYRVLETLPDASSSAGEASSAAQVAATAAAAAAEAEATTRSAAVKSEEDIMMEKMQVYWQFIVGMLTNQGAMPLPRIMMMLKFAVPGGFPYSSEELKDFLGRMVGEGGLELVGGNYRILK